MHLSSLLAGWACIAISAEQQQIVRLCIRKTSGLRIGSSYKLVWFLQQTAVAVVISSVDLPFQHLVLLDFHSERFVRAQRFLRPWIHFVHRTLQRERICNGFGWHGVHDNWPCCSLNVKSCRGPNRCGEHQSRAGELASQVKEFCPRAWATLSESPGALSDQLLRLPVNYVFSCNY